MAEHIGQKPEQAPDGHHDDGHHDVNYTKIYLILLVLLVISILGPELGIQWVTLVTAFGIALVKATMVIQNFMHLKWEKSLVKWTLVVSLLFVALFFFGVAPDVLKHDGVRWVNDAAIAAVERGIPTEGHGEEEGEHAAEGEEHTEDGEGGPGAEGSTEVAAAPVAFSAQQAYATTCATCHGPQGAGDGPGSAALDPPPASFTTAEFWDRVTRESMTNVIQNGGAAAGLSAAMPAWGALYGDEQIQQIVDYLETFRPNG